MSLTLLGARIGAYWGKKIMPHILWKKLSESAGPAAMLAGPLAVSILGFAAHAEDRTSFSLRAYGAEASDTGLDPRVSTQIGLRLDLDPGFGAFVLDGTLSQDPPQNSYSLMAQGRSADRIDLTAGYEIGQGLGYLRYSSDSPLTEDAERGERLLGLGIQISPGPALRLSGELQLRENGENAEEEETLELRAAFRF